MRILITGGAGFIGSHLAGRLLSAGNSVDVLDTLSTGSLANLQPIAKQPGFRFCQGSILDRGLLKRLVDSCDMVYHLAAVVGVRLVLKEPLYSLHTNVAGTEAVLEACSEKLRPVVVASSSEVYGKSATVPFREESDLVIGATTTTRWGYACSKAMDEFLALAYYRELNLPVTVIRLFNVTGPRQSAEYGMVLPNFIRQALRGEPITIFGSGQQTRCFSHVSDVVEALWRIAGAPNVAGEVINLGGDREISINDLAHLVRQVAESESRVVHIPYKQAYGDGFEDMMIRRPSLSKAERLLTFRPTRSLVEIVESIVQHERRLLSAELPTAAVSA